MLTPPTPSPRRARRTNVSKALPSPPRVGLVTARLGPRLETLMHQQDPHNFAEYVRSTVNLIRAFTMFKIQGPEPPLVDVVPPCGRECCQAIPRGCDKTRRLHPLSFLSRCLATTVGFRGQPSDEMSRDRAALKL